jgi:predicted alpha/beta superfamily hydrolase
MIRIGMMLTVFGLIVFGRAVHAQDDSIIIGNTVRLQSSILNEERTLQISLPTGYGNSQERYPVIFVLDGRGQFAQTVGAVRFLGRVNKIPQAIVVGIPNTNRNRDLSPPITDPDLRKAYPDSGGADSFLAFLTEEVRSYVDEHYRTWPFQILFGHSLGGLFTVHTFLNSPDAFSAHIASSPALWVDNAAAVRSAEEILDTDPDRRGFLFLSHGNEVELMTESIGAMVKTLKNRPLNEFIYRSWVFDFTYLYEAFNPENKKFTAGILIDHYKNLTEKYGYDCRPAEYYYNLVGYDLLREKSVNSAIELFKANVIFYPESANTYDSLAEAYMIAGDKKQAIKYYEKSLALNPENANAEESLRELRK